LVIVDVSVLATQARRVFASSEMLEALDLDRLVVAGELLPDWYDDWVVIDRERVRQLRLHALERACERLTASGRFGEAIEAGLAAVAEEPLHESAHRVLIEAHLAEGNRDEAFRQYEAYAQAMWQDLRLEPSLQIRALVERTGGPRSRRSGDGPVTGGIQASARGDRNQARRT
jgi:DNA-binding SARP family transcriptional activator